MGQGVYVIPIHDKLFGEVLPSMEEIAASLAEKEHVKIMPTGQYALNKIGLSNQVPMKMVFLTNGTKKNITIGKSSILFQPTEYSGQTEPLNPGQTEPVIPGQTEPLIPVKLSHLRV
jgi:hypothetical protein